MENLDDDVEIFSRLERIGKTGFDPAVACVLDFVQEEIYHLLIFQPAGPSKGCRLFTIIANHTGEQKLLLQALLELPEKGNDEFLKTEALVRLEKMTSSLKNNEKFFDAH
jgi:hypothetical protein